MVGRKDKNLTSPLGSYPFKERLMNSMHDKKVIKDFRAVLENFVQSWADKPSLFLLLMAVGNLNF